VIDAIDLRLSEDRLDALVQLARRLEVGCEGLSITSRTRLLALGLVQARVAEAAVMVGTARARGQVEDALLGTVRCVDAFEAILSV